jgi:hypothetical protein
MIPGRSAESNCGLTAKSAAFPLPAAQVESVNIVGYQTLTATGPYFSSGPTFIAVGDANGEWKLGDITASGMDPFSDFIQFLSTANAETELMATYVDSATSQSWDGTDDWVGWWDVNDIGVTSLDDQTFGAGTGFLCSFASAGIALTYAGEVLQGSTTLDLSGLQYPLVANLTPVDLTLGDLTASGMDPFSDFIQFLNVANAETELMATYVDSATSQGWDGTDDWVGWWDVNDIGVTSLDAQPLPAGSAVLGSFASAGVQITFPSPI